MAAGPHQLLFFLWSHACWREGVTDQRSSLLILLASLTDKIFA
jgi:hypothetical protein